MRTRLSPYLFVSPAMLLLIAFGVFPILVALAVSMTNMPLAKLLWRSKREAVSIPTINGAKSPRRPIPDGTKKASRKVNATRPL